MFEKLFIICVDGNYGEEYYYLVKSVSKEEAIAKATAKFKSLNNLSTTTMENYLGTSTEIEFDVDGISQLLINAW